MKKILGLLLIGILFFTSCGSSTWSIDNNGTQVASGTVDLNELAVTNYIKDAMTPYFEPLGGGGTSGIYQEWYYKLLCAISDPSLVVRKNSGSWQPAELDYVFGGSGYRVSGMTTGLGFVDNSPAGWLPDICTFFPSETYSILASCHLLFVTDTSVNSVTNPIERFYQRYQYTRQTVPSRVVVDNQAPTTLQYFDISDNSIITRVSVQNGWEVTIMYASDDHSARTFGKTLFDIGESGDFTIGSCADFFALPATDSTHHWEVMTCTKNNTGVNASFIVEYYTNLPAWW